MSSSHLMQVDSECLKAVQFIATDMDGTLTQRGLFTAELIHTLEHLARVEISVLIVTGRSAGWVSGLVHYLPVVGAIAENGGIFFPGHATPGKTEPGKTEPDNWLVPVANLATHRQQLAHIFAELKQKFPQLQESTDNRYRLTDWTFDVQGLTLSDLEQLSQHCQHRGWSITYSTVQVHIKLPQQTKAAGLLTVLAQSFPHLTPHQIVTVGDSPNDESLFDAAQFPFSVGVANLQDYRDRLLHHPTCITTAAEGAGFCELAQQLIRHKVPVQA
ncbi:MAG: HAD-IIB family hydrolase [Leptolyngbyaceae cyanobacterium bins.349]|nr:HAD-IIB family hydrolase [Leptolyngbyaceae cyanobacterium bins.349]